MRQFVDVSSTNILLNVYAGINLKYDQREIVCVNLILLYLISNYSYTRTTPLK